MYEYVTLGDSIWREAERHICRGLVHLATGNAEYAAGSFKKAQRKMEKADLWGCEGMWSQRSADEIKADVRRGWDFLVSSPQMDMIRSVRTMTESELPDWLRRHVWKGYRR